MGRLTVALAAVLCLLTSADANATPTRGLLARPGVEVVRPVAPAKSPPAAGEFALTADSEVILDGRPCAYKSVPAGATVLWIEVGPDRKTIRRIEFRTPR